MKISQFISVFSAPVLLTAVTLAMTTPAHAQGRSIFDSQQSNSEAATSPESKTPPLTISGMWSGDIDDNLAGDGTLDADFTESPNGDLTGEWSFIFDAGTDYGTIKGKATSDGVSISFIFVPKKPYVHCKFSIKTKASDTEISAPYHFTACGPLTKTEHGTLTISP